MYKQKNLFWKVMLGVLLSIFSIATVALTNTQPESAVLGNWQTIDEKTQQPSSVIAIYRDGDAVVGKVIKTFHIPGRVNVKTCRSCVGDRQNKPILGLTIIKDMQCQQYRCAGGTILDPRDGKLYHATMTLADAGRLLKVRGYVGISLFGKTVVWQRVKRS